MKALSLISNTELLARMPSLVLAERARSADVIEHLVEIDRRRLYLGQACSSLSSYCSERLGYSEDEASKRVRVARLAGRFPQVLDELRGGAIHLTGLLLLSSHVTEENCRELLSEARHKSKSAIERLIATHFPKQDIPDRIRPVPEQLAAAALNGTGAQNGAESPKSCSGASRSAVSAGRVEPLSASRWSVQFTASNELREKIEQARELLSHALPSGDLASLIERALDELIKHETKRRMGAGKPRKKRKLSEGSRHVPVDIARLVWERDNNQCAFVDEQGHRCSAKRFLTIEHRNPFVFGGPPTVENLCLLCAAHNAHAARKVFGEEHVEAKRAEREKNDLLSKVHKALRKLGFSEAEVCPVLRDLKDTEFATDPESLLRAALNHLVPATTPKT
jgi:hypothetical protein